MSGPLAIRDLHVSYGGRPVLRGLSLDLHPGRIRIVIGPNGAGKSTLLNTVAGLVRPDRGSIAFEGRSLAGRAPDAIARSGVVLVPQGHPSFPDLSVELNLALGGYGRRRDAAWHRDLERLADWFPILGQRRSQRAGTLSGGEQQVLAIARALMRQPRLLLLDEPSLGLSAAAGERLVDVLLRIREETGMAMLVVEQNRAVARRLVHAPLPSFSGARNLPKGRGASPPPALPSTGSGPPPREAPSEDGPGDDWIVLDAGRPRSAGAHRAHPATEPP